MFSHPKFHQALLMNTPIPMHIKVEQDTVRIKKKVAKASLFVSEHKSK